MVRREGERGGEPLGGLACTSEHDLEQAAASAAAGRFDWSCFAAHQAAEKAVKALHLGHEAWEHVVALWISMHRSSLRGANASPTEPL